MCGVVGIVSSQPVSQEIYDALLVLQHRGQDSAGIVTSSEGRCHMRKDNGLVSEVFRQRHIDTLRGNIGLGHNRYPTAGSASSLESQPMYVNSPHGIYLAHNGNLTNTKELRRFYFRNVMRHINTTSDSEILLNVFANELALTASKNVDPSHIFDAVRGVNTVCRGAYAAVALIRRGRNCRISRSSWHSSVGCGLQTGRYHRLHDCKRVCVRCTFWVTTLFGMYVQGKPYTLTRMDTCTRRFARRRRNSLLASSSMST